MTRMSRAPRRVAKFVPLIVIIAGGCGKGDDPMGCGGATCPFAVAGYATITGSVMNADETPFVRSSKDAVWARCGSMGYGESTDSRGNYRFDLRPISVPADQTVMCYLSVRFPADTVRDSVRVVYSDTPAGAPEYTVHFREGDSE